jgi:hypothetical protein
MKTLAVITFGQSRFDDRLKRLLDESGIDPEEFEDLEYFGLLPFFVLAGASVRTDAEGHGDHLHFQGVRVELPEDLEEAFFTVLPHLLEQAYADVEEEEEEEEG